MRPTSDVAYRNRVATSGDPALGAEHREALELGIRVLLERLAPRERAAYVLHEAFDYPYSQIASILQTTEANVGQLVLVPANTSPPTGDVR